MLPIPWLSHDPALFPPLNQALDEPNGLLALGGDLSPSRLIHAYRRGIFPWFNPQQPILWWSPDPRAILIPNQVYVSKSLQKLIRQQRYEVRWDTAFTEVIRHCANTPRHGEYGTWISDEMITAYSELFTLGYAHSVEIWEENTLVGGLYGLSIGKAFFGESMFSLRPNASKIALVALARRLDEWKFKFIDCQASNPHLFSMGAREIPRQAFERLLKEAIDLPGPQEWPLLPVRG